MNEVSQAVFASNVRHVAMLDGLWEGKDVEGTEDTGFTCLQISKDVDNSFEISFLHVLSYINSFSFHVNRLL